MSGHRRKEGTTYGNARMYKWLIFALKRINVKVFHIFMNIFVIPGSLIFSKGAHLTRQYYYYKRGYSRWKALVSTYRNHCIFGETVVDKFAMYAGKKFKINFNGLELYKQKSEEEKPLLLLNAHIGCSEILGYSLYLDKPCNVLVYGGEKQSLMAYRASSFGTMNINMIPVGTEDSKSQEIIDALERGENISAFADRFMNRNKVILSTIHSCGVMLARGPFSLAVNREIDVIMVSAMKEKDGSYSAFLTPLLYDKSLSHKEQREQLANAYTTEINRLLDMYPLQWFNYSDIWVNLKKRGV